MRELARSLIDFENTAPRSPDEGAPAAARVCERLRPHLAALMGNGGIHALLSRTLALARAEDIGLCDVRIQPDGSLDGWPDENGDGTDPEKSTAPGVVLVARLLELLAAFIGENLTFRLVADVWPELLRPLGKSERTRT